jgi:hypothetical protein
MSISRAGGRGRQRVGHSAHRGKRPDLHEDFEVKLLSRFRRNTRTTPVAGGKIFVIGSGRSGTHWVGYILEGHRDIHVTIEKPPIFRWVTDIALDLGKKAELLPGLIERYRAEHDAVRPRHYADKSHPNIWIAEELATAFGDARFIGIQRNPYGTVASMLKHPGVLAWHARWKEFPVPNPFLGITRDNHDAYESMPLAAKCALRWKAHRERMHALGEALGPRLLVLQYEDVIRDPDTQLRALDAFLSLPSPIPRPKVKAESLDRWRTELDDEAKSQIAAVTGISQDQC